MNTLPPSHLASPHTAVGAPVVALKPTDLNLQGGIHCPTPLAGMKQWNTHPKVYLDVAKTGHAKCPYCGTVYKVDGTVPLSH